MPGASAKPGTGTGTAPGTGRHEQQVGDPAGRRHSGARAPGLAGTGLVADDLYLLVHDDRTGKALLQQRALGTGLAGGLLAELMLAGWIGLRPDSAVVITRDAPLAATDRHPLLSRVAGEPGAQPLGSWLRFLAASAAPEVAGRLERAGYLERVRGRVRRDQGQWVPVNPDWAIAPMFRVRSALDPARPLTAHAAALTGLAVACGLGFRLDQYQAHAGRTVQDAVARLGPGLRDLIAQTRTAVDTAVLSQRT